jgi:hypothetical protein
MTIITDMNTTQRKLPFGPEKLSPFTEELFDREEEKAARILWSILETQSPRKSDLSQVFGEKSSEGANYRTIDRVLPKLDAKKALLRLYDPETPFVLVDPTEIERKQAKNTDYVGRLSDGKTLGFWTIVFAQPYRGRAIPFHFGVYSEETLNREAQSSRNLQWRKLVWEIKELVGGDVPLVYDREFSAQQWLETMNEAGLHYVVRLNTASRVKIKDEGGKEIPLVVGKGKTKHIRKAYYRGEVEVKVSGVWQKGQKEPLWVMGNSPSCEQLIEVYQERMKIEQSFRDNKSLLNLDKVMNKKREQLEITLALVFLAYGLGLMIGEEARDEAYGGGGGGGGGGGDEKETGGKRIEKEALS